MPNKTKIIATIGPASSSRPVLEKLVKAGMCVALLNFSHGSYEEHVGVIQSIRSIARVMNRPIGILLDLQGPKIRTGKLQNGEPVPLKRNHIVELTTRNVPSTAERISTTYGKLVQDVKKGAKVLLDDGLIELKVLSKSADTVKCRVVSGGLLKENKGINLPGIKVSAPSLTSKDKRDIDFGIKNGVDYFALSFVRQADDLKRARARIARQGANIPVIAKIEKPEAVENLNAILQVADGIMVARGDLGVELNPEQVPTIQKHIIHAAIQANRPVITATQMLESMNTNPIPTRAEASDVANAIFDGTDAVMLSGETAAGRYPVQAVRMMAKIAAQAERSPFMKYNLKDMAATPNPIAQAVAQSAVNITHEVNARSVVAFSASGSTHKLISRQRPIKPVYGFTSDARVYNRMALVWGVIPMYIAKIDDAQRLVKASENLLLDKQLARKDDLIVLVIGLGLKEGSTNLIKIHRVGHED